MLLLGRSHNVHSSEAFKLKYSLLLVAFKLLLLSLHDYNVHQFSNYSFVIRAGPGQRKHLCATVHRQAVLGGWKVTPLLLSRQILINFFCPRRFDIGVYATLTSVNPLRVYTHQGDWIVRLVVS